MNGRILVINTGSTSSKIGFYDSGEKLFETNLTHTAEEIARYESVMDQTPMRRDAITDFLSEKGIALETIDVAMARGGLITPIRTGVYEVNQEMRDALMAGKEGVHACNLSALLADDIAVMVNEARAAKGIQEKCRAFIADPPMADEMLPEVKVSGLPEFPRRTLFHALNSRAMVRRYARSVGKTNKDVTVIVAHMGGGFHSDEQRVHGFGRLVCVEFVVILIDTGASVLFRKGETALLNGIRYSNDFAILHLLKEMTAGTSAAADNSNPNFFHGILRSM